MLALGLGPAKALTPPRLHVERAPSVRLDVEGLMDPVRAAIPQVEVLGNLLGDGVVLGELHLGVEGQPSMPFLNPFYYAQEIRITHVDAATLATSLMVTGRIDF